MASIYTLNGRRTLKGGIPGQADSYECAVEAHRLAREIQGAVVIEDSDGELYIVRPDGSSDPLEGDEEKVWMLWAE